MRAEKRLEEYINKLKEKAKKDKNNYEYLPNSDFYKDCNYLDFSNILRDDFGFDDIQSIIFDLYTELYYADDEIQMEEP